MKTPRLKIRKRVDVMATYDFEGTLSRIRDRLEDLINQHGPDASLNYDPHFYYDYDHEPTPRYEVYVERDETDDEVKVRLLQNAEHIRKREEAEKAEFERLSKKFGGQK